MAGTAEQLLADDDVGRAALAVVVVVGEEEELGGVEEEEDEEVESSEVGWTSGEIDEEKEEDLEADEDERLFRWSGSLRGTENLQPMCGMFEMEMCLAPESLGRPEDDVVDEEEDGAELTEQTADEVGVGCDVV